jgi:ABC-type transport system involved in multi-copper enzyme maturation permease subunit
MGVLPRFSPRRVWWIAEVTALDAVRQRIFHLLVVLAAASVCAARAFRDFNFASSDPKFIADFGFGAFAVFGSVLTIVLVSQLFLAEIEHRTALTLLAKPVRRAEFVLGKYFGAMSGVTFFCGLVTVLLWIVLRMEAAAHPSGAIDGAGLRTGEILAAGFAHWLKFGLLGAATLLVGSFARTHLYATTLSFGVLVICELQVFAERAYVHADSWWVHGFSGTLAVVFPDFQVFALSDRLGDGAGISMELLGRLVLYAAAYGTVFCGAAIYAFNRREV